MPVKRKAEQIGEGMKSQKSAYITIPQLAKVLGISRIAVFKKVKSGVIKATRIGRTYAIPRKYLEMIQGKKLSAKQRQVIDTAVRKTVREYGQVLKLLGNQ